jgi:hypothetical protein
MVDAGLWQTLADAIAMLESRSIACAVIGGLAVSLRGQPRMTVDVDLVIATDLEATLRLAQELPGTAFDPLFAGVEEVVNAAFILPLRHRTTGVRVDLAIGLSGFEREAISRASRIEIGETAAPVVKALAGRPQDEQDIRGIVDLHGNRIDWTACLTTAKALGEAVDIDVASRLQAARRHREQD